jgi:hypothetical protein
MDARELAEQLIDSLAGIVSATEYSCVTRVDLCVGTRWAVAARDLEMCFDDLLDALPTDGPLAGAVPRVRVVSPGEEFPAPRRSDVQTATGWELLVTNVEGVR